MKPKFVIGIGLIIGAVIAVMAFTILNNNSQEVKVNDLLTQTAGGVVPDRSFKVTGVVVGDSIVYDQITNQLEFDIVHSREDLHNNLATAGRVRIKYHGVRPDTLVNEATAIVTGKISSDGHLVAANSPDALLLQCPTKYENAAKQAAAK
jgi:cytochrome c-type biogenesis protein CcmE